MLSCLGFKLPSIFLSFQFLLSAEYKKKKLTYYIIKSYNFQSIYLFEIPFNTQAFTFFDTWLFEHFYLPAYRYFQIYSIYKRMASLSTYLFESKSNFIVTWSSFQKDRVPRKVTNTTIFTTRPLQIPVKKAINI
jgi:hypothetical protein